LLSFLLDNFIHNSVNRFSSSQDLLYKARYDEYVSSFDKFVL
jgi:hypothetical protein